MSNLEEIIKIPLSVLELFTGSLSGTYTPRTGSTGGKPPSTAALTDTKPRAGSTTLGSIGTGSGQQTYATQQKATQQPTTRMPTVAPPPVTRRPAGVRFK